MLVSYSTILISQEITGNNEKPEQNSQPVKMYPMKDYWPMLQTDPRFKITGINVDRRFAKNGSGEFLDILFYLENLTSQQINLVGYVMAFWETNAIDKAAREYIPYPAWRKRDYDKEKNIIHFMKISPINITTAQIWDYKDSDFYHQNKILAKRRNSVIGNQRPVLDTYPPFWKYIEYAKHNSEKGLAFPIYGDVGPTEDKQLITNFVDATQEEKKTKVFKKIDQHTYTLEFSRGRTIFRSFHFSKFRADYKFFNRFAIIILDADRLKIFNEQKNRELKPGEEKINPLVAQRILKMHKPLRNN